VDRIEILNYEDSEAAAAAVFAPALPCQVLAGAAANSEDLHLPHSIAPQRCSSVQATTRPLRLVAREKLRITGIERGHSSGTIVVEHRKFRFFSWSLCVTVCASRADSATVCVFLCV